MNPPHKKSDDRAVFQYLVEAVPVGMALVDKAGRIAMVNPLLASTFGYAAAELIGQSIEILLPERAREQHRTYHAQFEAAPAMRHMAGRKLAGRHRDGHEISVEVGLNSVALGGQPYVAAALLDVTPRLEAERRLAEREARLRTLMDHAPVAISVLSPDGTILEANRFLLRLLGRDSAGVVNHHIREFQVPGAAEQRVATYQALVHQGAGSERDVELQTAAGATVLMDFSIVRVRYGNEDLVVGIGRDVTSERSVEQQLQRAQRMEAVARLAGGVAHDFNNLLSAIQGYGELLREDLPPGSPVRGDVDEILLAGRRAADLTRQLLAFSRKQVLQPRILDLNEVVAGTEKMLRRIIGEDVRLLVKTDPQGVRVEADQGQIEQVIMNLAVNARDAMPKGGTLSIDTATVALDETYAAAHQNVPPGSYGMLAITDTGIGMSKEIQARIFEPFFTTKEPGKGTGLGLATVYGIVKQSGGYIWVYSEPGKGSTFRVYLPRAHGEVQPMPVAPPVAVRGGIETILVVEDDAQLRRLTRQVLERHGYRVLDAESPAHALTAVAQHHGTIELLLTDMVMPGMSGRDLAERLLRDRPGMRVAYMSGHSEEAIAHYGVLAPGTELLQKPASLQQLLQKVRETLDR
jgi:two-component system, cell cycle sensor histidine kinase and response regulator CckA